MSGSMSAAQQAQQIRQQNKLMRANFIASSKYLRINQTNATNLVAGTNDYQIPLQSLGFLTSVDLEFNFTISNTGTAAATLQPLAPFSFLSQISFVDQGSLTRSQISGPALLEILNALTTQGFPWSASAVLNNGPVTSSLNYPLLPATIPAGASATYTFRIHLPVSRSKMDLTGGVLLQTSQNSTAANVKFSLAPLTGTPSSPFGMGGSNIVLAMTSGTVSMRQNYWQPFNNVDVPPLDVQTVNYMWETSPDTTNLVTGMVKEIPLQIQYSTDMVGLSFYNGGSFTFGTDIATMEEWLGNTRLTNSTPTQRYLDYRLARGFDENMGRYLFDYRMQPLLNQMLGTFTIRFQPEAPTVQGSAFVRSWYRQKRPVGTVSAALLQAIG